ncbi:DNA-binding transcriptional regulator, AcrR family [Amycolatopsis xylanica]|uniref:DNA-binding transcriptional regulator, AcrR family n=1 Tax=Amycolatopsis xylanica TaxID=589385 RepID=A0A1H3HLR2_9PSEU|nr:TetR/AcrR family transcriptional regulator [Amycolatopsis xylanica]SDY16402.1 DNA-binding transcriptional regulator, AcrR family [Amycolatopsis xylanica]
MTAEDIRSRLVDAAVHLLAEGGPEALQARKVAAEVGASTMAVYTHFGGMGELVEAVAREGFRRLRDNLGRIPPGDDPVADIFVKAYAYRHTAVEHPQLYAVTFGLSAPGGKRAAIKGVADLTDANSEEGREALSHIVDASARAIEAGRFRQAEPLEVASQLWSGVHGYVTLEIAGHFGEDNAGVNQVLLPLGVTLAVGLGDTPESAARSQRVAVDTWRKANGNAGHPSDDVR